MKLLFLWLALNSCAIAGSKSITESKFLSGFPEGMLKKIADSNYLVARKDLGTQGMLLLRLTVQEDEVVAVEMSYTPVLDPKKSAPVVTQVVALLFRAFTGAAFEKTIARSDRDVFWHEVETAALNPCKKVSPLKAKRIEIAFHACQWDYAAKDGGYVCNIDVERE